MDALAQRLTAPISLPIVRPDRLPRMKLAAMFLAGLVGMSTGSALAKDTAPAINSPFEIPHDKYTLPNGLEVILHQDLSLPMVAINLWYHVGPVNEPAQRSGFAHLFEHLMFEGSKHAGNQFDYLLESVGGTNMNGTTSWDRTNYYETVPAEHLELALWLEADRMGFMIDTLTQEALDVQREVVKNERRENYENSPYGPSSLALYNTLFPQGHPYHGAIIGSMDDLTRANLQDVGAFFEEYYAPANATLVIAGHFNESTARRLVDKHFATLPARGSGKGKHRAQLPPRRVASASPSAARVVVEEDVQLPQIAMAWQVPPAYSNEEPALEIAARVLGQGRASRLYQALVVTGLSNGAGASLDSNQVDSVLSVQARAASGHSLEELEGSLLGELQRLSREGPTEGELTRAKNAIKLEFASQLQSLDAQGGEGGRAGLLQRLNHYLGDPAALPGWMLRYQAVTAAEVRDVIAKHLRPEGAVVVLTKTKTATTVPPAVNPAASETSTATPSTPAPASSAPKAQPAPAENPPLPAQPPPANETTR